MSDKDRKKKDGERKDKNNQLELEDVAARQAGDATPRERQKHEAKLTNSIPEGEARMRKKE